MAREEMKMVREDQTVAYGLAWILINLLQSCNSNRNGRTQRSL